MQGENNPQASGINRYSGWGRYPQVDAHTIEPAHESALRHYLTGNTFPCIARGNLRSYGDAALCENMISMCNMRQILDFDAENGTIYCEAGVLLCDILAVTVPAGWFFHVIPGIKDITVGGAIASDVHGKNHVNKGCFSRWLIHFEMMDARGDILYCSPTDNAALFWQTCGGMGWTGVILRARFQLCPIQTTRLRQYTVRTTGLAAMMAAFDANQSCQYGAGWLDFSSPQLKGLAFFADHMTAETPDLPTAYRVKPAINIPFVPPLSLVNRWSIKAYHAWYYFRRKTGEQIVALDDYFFPLDKIGHWNRLYGPQGFVQYQFCLPAENAVEGMQAVAEAIFAARLIPFIPVLKRHGDANNPSGHSFPVKGWSLALDFPRKAAVFALAKQLDQIVWDNGGRVYLTKDSCSHGRMGRVDPRTFGHARFVSRLKSRILRDLDQHV